MFAPAVLLFFVELSAVAAEPTPLPPEVQVVVDATELKASLRTLGPPETVALVVATKANETALVELLGVGEYRYLRAGSASESTAPLHESGLACGVFLARQGADHWRAKAIGTCDGTKPAPAAVAAVAAAPVAASAPIAPTTGVATAAVPTTVVAPGMDLAAYTSAQKELLRLETSLPSPAAAVLLSALVGFGSGHFYAGSPQTGQVHLALQIVGLVAIGVGSALANDYDTESAGQVIGAIGIAGFGIDRIVEAANAPFKAHQTSARILASGDPRIYDSSHTW